MEKPPRTRPKKKRTAPDHESVPPGASVGKVTLYPAWCKRCGNCVAFCPRQVLEKDEWGYPTVAHPERCITCHLCEMLCPDFALSVGEASAPDTPEPREKAPAQGAPRSPVTMPQSPERVAPEPPDKETGGD
jgi:2-oxoglutarate ferredoxin oxidoreductase subunit delta